MSDKRKYDEILKDKLDQFEVEYNSAHWTEMKQKLHTPNGGSNGFGNSGILKLVTGIAIVSSVGIIAYTQFLSSEKEQKNPVETTEQLITKSENEKILFTQKDADKLKVLKYSTPERGAVSDTNKRKQGQHQLSNSLTNPIESNPYDIEDELKNYRVVLSSTNNTICEGEQIHLAVANAVKGIKYSWFVNSKEIAHGPETSALLGGRDQYTIKVIASWKGGESEDETQINILPAPNTGFTVNNLSPDFADPYVIFQVEDESLTKINWDFGNSQKSTENRAAIFYDKAESYMVMLSVIGANGCRDSAIRTIEVNPNFEFGDVNAFSPNGDGANETFVPDGLERIEVPFTFTIYSSSGDPIFSTNHHEEWNGRVHNTGELLGIGSFIWIVKVQIDNDNTIEAKGPLQLIR